MTRRGFLKLGAVLPLAGVMGIFRSATPGRNGHRAKCMKIDAPPGTGKAALFRKARRAGYIVLDTGGQPSRRIDA